MLKSSDPQSLAFDLPLGSEDATRDRGNVFILWVDDVPSNNTHEANRIRQAGCEVLCITSTVDAIEWLTNNEDKKKDPCFRVITDRVRKEGTTDNVNAGMELLDWMRNNGWMTPVLVYTSSFNLSASTQKFGNLIVTSNTSQVYNFAFTIESAEDRKVKTTSNVFAGCVFCLTGEFSMSNADLEKLIFDNGGRISRGISGQVTHLLQSTTGGSGVLSGKVAAAVSLNIPIVREAFVANCIKEGRVIAITAESSAPTLENIARGTATVGMTKEKAQAKAESARAAVAAQRARGPPNVGGVAMGATVKVKTTASTSAGPRKRKAADVESDSDADDDDDEEAATTSAAAPPAKKQKRSIKGGKGKGPAAVVDDHPLVETSNKLVDPSKRIFAADKIIKEGKRGDSIKYLVKWTGLPTSKATWEPEANVRIDKSLWEEWQIVRKRLGKK